MLWQIERMLLERKSQNLSMPRFLLMENVRNIMSKKHENNFEMWKKSLRDMGYVNYVFPLNAMYFGIPQKRIRAYMISIYVGKDEKLKKKIDNYFKKNDLTKITEPNQLNRKAIHIEDILRMDYSNPIYKKEAEESQPRDTPSRRDIYVDNEKLYSKGRFAEIAPTLTTKQDRHPNSGVIDFNSGKKGMSTFRYITPREGFMFMGFDESDYESLLRNNFPANGRGDVFTRDKMNKMAGNSIVVNVLEEIFKQIDYIDKNIFREI